LSITIHILAWPDFWTLENGLYLLTLENGAGALETSHRDVLIS
jgi:hypothetical protein